MKKVAIIGAGAAGLASIKCCLDEGLQPVCFEQCSDIGGCWLYSEEEGHSSVYQSTIINTSKEMNSFSDFPMPKEFPPFMTHHKMMAYYRLYAAHFDLLRYINFDTKIIRVNRDTDYTQNGRWEVYYQKSSRDGVQTGCKVFDAVLVCSGHLWQPRWAHLPGLDKFTGRQMHSHSYKHFRGFEEKTVLVIGLGNSAGDIACELSRHAKQVYVSTRRGAWVQSRTIGTLPMDYYYTRFLNDVPNWVKYRVTAWILIKNINHEQLGLQPSEDYWRGAAIMNEDIESRIITGTLLIKPDVEFFTATGVQFNDGTSIQDIDVVIHCTGYHVGFSFLDESVIKVRENELNLYKFVFPPDELKPTIAFIGFVTIHGSMNPTFEIQARWVTRLLKGNVHLPSREEMWTDVKKTRTAMLQNFSNTPRHAFEANGLTYADEIASFIGCRPNLWKLLLTDPVFALRCYFGPCTPAQYRLRGPGKWPGAKASILNVYTNLIYPTKTRTASEDHQGCSTVGARALKLVVLAAAVVVAYKLAARFEVFKTIDGFKLPFELSPAKQRNLSYNR